VQVASIPGRKQPVADRRLFALLMLTERTCPVLNWARMIDLKAVESVFINILMGNAEKLAGKYSSSFMTLYILRESPELRQRLLQNSAIFLGVKFVSYLTKIHCQETNQP
jgi:hypothetical protein